MKDKKIVIIGAGPSGLAQLRAFYSAQQKGVEIPQIICFEKQDDLGGLWNYNWRTGLDEFGEPVHCSMYRYLWSNGPKECLEFADYSFEEHFGKPIASYPPREVLRNYIVGRVNKSDLRRFIRFRSPVRMVQYDTKTKKFSVTVEDLKNQQTYTEVADYVVVASGHFSVPNSPSFPGFSSFGGRILHAHDFRDALEFQKKDILIVGTSYSAEDIGSQCYKYGARSITISHRTRSTGFKWPNNIHEVPLLTHVDTHKAYFKDGSSKRIDAIILCTGYLHHFPFMSENLRLRTNNCLWPLGLYKGIVWEKNPQLFYLGMQDQYYTFNMFDAQAWYARDVILGKIILPDTSIMNEDSKDWKKRERSLLGAKDEIYFQGDYVKYLISQTDYPDFDVDGVNEAFIRWKNDKIEDIMNFRNKTYRSLLTGTMAPQHHTPWLTAMDDSLESYLASGEINYKAINESYKKGVISESVCL